MDRIFKMYTNIGFCYMDKISGEYYEYKPSVTDKFGRKLGYDLERLTTRECITYVAEIAKYEDEDRSKDKYRINGQAVTIEEFKKHRKSRTVPQKHTEIEEEVK